MEIFSNQTQLEAYLKEAYLAPDKPLLVDEYLGHATELDVDAAGDGKEVLVGAIMEHLEEAGIHSGDSTCFIPAQNISEEMLTRVEEQTKIIGLGLNIKGCFNIQFAIQGDDLYVLEVNPRSSRTVPFVANPPDYHSQRLRQTSRLEYLYQNKQFQNGHLDRSVLKHRYFRSSN